MRKIGVITVGRSDYSIYLPLLRLLRDDPSVDLRLIVAGMHLSPTFGMTADAIEADGFEIAERVEMLLASDAPEAIAKSMGLGVIGFAGAFARLRPDIVMVLGDRFEMHAAALAALPFRIPVAHFSGGELTFGAIDDALRHSITKLSHLHFVSTEVYAERVMRMGEEPWRVQVTGTMSVDNVRTLTPLPFDELRARFGLRIEQPFLLVTWHPVTLEHESTGRHIEEVLAALDGSGMPVLFTMPNADTGGRIIREAIERWTERHPASQWVESLGTLGYLGAMASAAAMVGNSSSGIVEAASFELPVVNIGTRQEGRVRSANVIDVGCDRWAIGEAIGRALSPDFRESLVGLVSPYGDGHAAERIAEALAIVQLDDRLIMKRFNDDPIPAASN